MKRLLTVAAVLTMMVSSAGAAIDASNPDWLIYRDPFGTGTAEDLSYYDQYAEVAQGDTLTLHVVVNFNTGDWTQVQAYHSAFWYDTAVVDNYPTPNYSYSWMGNMANPNPADYQANGYVQLYNYNTMGSAQSIWEEPAAAPFVVVSWDLQISATAPLGTSTIPMRWRSYTWGGAEIGAHYIEHDPVFTINVVADFAVGDFDEDGDIDADDVDDLCANIGIGDLGTYDMDNDGDVDEDDVIFHVENLLEYDTDDDGIVDGQGTFRGDFNTDGSVNGTDLSIMSGNFGGSAGFAGGNANCDASVNGTDLSILSSTFGNVVTAAVPEPLTMGLLSLGGIALLRRRK
jgi:hypothetical protein